MAPFRPETAWRVEGGELVETTGRRERRWPLAALRRLTLTPRGAGGRQGAWLAFPRGRVTLASHSLSGLGVYEDRSDSFGALVRAIAAGAADAGSGVRVSTTAFDHRSALTGVVGLLGIGAAAMLFLSLGTGAAGLGVSLAARMLFVLILVFAVTPWLKPASPALDPHDLPRALLP